MTAMEDNILEDNILENQAKALAYDRMGLFKRLKLSASCLKEEYKQHFNGDLYLVFNFEERRLYSTDGKYFLQYQIRRHPDAPVSVGNPQTLIGLCTLCVNAAMLGTEDNSEAHRTRDSEKSIEG